jgi:hypothetical protein
MSPSRILSSAFTVCTTALLAACSSPAPTAPAAAPPAATTTGNIISGEGLPNPAPVVTKNWGTLPAGRKWGTSAGIDIDPKDGHVWAYERCGAGTAGGGPVDSENTPVDPARSTGRPVPCSLTSARA